MLTTHVADLGRLAIVPSGKAVGTKALTEGQSTLDLLAAAALAVVLIPILLYFEIRLPVAGAAVHALHGFLEHPEACRTRDHQNPDRSIRPDRCLLRPGRASDSRFGAGARPEVPGSRCRRDSRMAGSELKLTAPSGQYDPAVV